MKLRTFYLAGIISVILINHCSAKGKGCFVSNIMISCLSIACEFGGTCPGDPDAVCRVEQPDKCAGCEQVWYRRDGTKAECGSRQNLELCPGGEPVVHCKVDSCKWPCTHPAFKDRPCRQNFCGKCSATYLFGDQWLKCPKTTTRFSGETLPVDLAVRERTTKACMHIPCPLDACVHQECLKFPDASCRPDGCNRCLPAWYLGNRPVDCISGEILPPVVIEPIDPLTGDRRICADGEPLMTCTDAVCAGETCPNYPRAVCRPDGCGQCKATWYDENVLVDCYATECPINVRRVKCIVDPCVYFGHYCPAAECRASECGRCEAKFFVGQKEISCVQPPKQCLPGENTMVCPWYTCNTNVCPSNLNLMCRINPCGLSCQREWVNFKTGEIEPCKTFEKRPSNKHNEWIFMEDPLMRPHESNLLPGEKPYIEVKKDPVDTVVKTLESKTDPLAAQHFAVKEAGPMAIPIPMKTSLHADIKHQMTPMAVPGQDTFLDKMNPNIRTIPVPMKAGVPAGFQHEIGTGPIPVNQIIGAIPVPMKAAKPRRIQQDMATGHIPINPNFRTMPVPMEAGVPTSRQHEKAMGHIPINPNKRLIPIPMKAAKPTRVQQEFATGHIPINPSFGAIPVPMKAAKPRRIQHEISSGHIPINSGIGSIPDPMKAAVPSRIQHEIAALPPPLKESRPAIGADGQLSPMLIPFRHNRHMSNQLVSGPVSNPIKHNRPIESPMLIPANIYPGQGNVAILGANNPELNNFLLEILGVGKIDNFPMTSKLNQPVESIGLMKDAAGVLPAPMKAKKPTIHSINDQFQMNPEPSVFRSPAVVDKNMQIIEDIPHIGKIPMTENMGVPSILDQNLNMDKPKPKMELIHNIPLPLKKRAGKPSFEPSMGVHPNSIPNLNVMNSDVPLAKTATKPQTFQPLYPELGLIQEKASNERFQQFLKQTGAHKNVPIKNDRARPMPIPNAIPPMKQGQWEPLTGL